MTTHSAEGSRPRSLFERVDSLQIPVPTLDAGLAFYRPLLGDVVRWRTDTALALAMEDGTEVVLQTERPHPETDVLVLDADDAAAEFVRAGGSILVEPFDLPVGRCAVVADPWGTALVLLDLSRGTIEVDDKGRVTGVSHTQAETSSRRSQLPAPSAIRDVYLIVQRGDEVLLLLRSATGYKDSQWGPPSGKVELGETYAAAAARELDEETGIVVSPDNLQFVHAIERAPEIGEHWLGVFFRVTVTDAIPQNHEPEKHSEIGFFPRLGLPTNTVDYVKHVLDAVDAGEYYTEWHYSAVEDLPRSP